MYVEPRFHFTYPFFSWISPWPGIGMYLHFVMMTLLAVMVALGVYYRIASLGLAISFSYFFLLDRTNYQNHYYLMLLMCWLMAWLPASQAFSWDAARIGTAAHFQIPQWNVWSLRFLIGLPYIFGGIAKLSADWFAGFPLRQTLQAHVGWPVVGELFANELAVQCFIWGGLLFDLTIVVWLLWNRTRVLAFVLCIAFHVINSNLFHIHVFPWFMILGTTVFFDPNWPRRLFGLATWSLPGSLDPVLQVSNRSKQRGIAMAGMLVALQFLIPFRHGFYPGDVNWTEQGHAFSWRMMLRGKQSVVRFYLTDESSGKTWNPMMKNYVNADQLSRFAMDPEMILQMGRFLEREHRKESDGKLTIQVLALTSMNGRKPQLLVDPETDISSDSKAFLMSDWIQPLREPLPNEPWSVPIREWERHVALPPMPIVNLQPALQQPQSG